METVLIIDSSSDLPLSFVKENNLISLGLTCHMQDKDYVDDFGGTLTYTEFYRRLRNGEMPTTSQINYFAFFEAFKSQVLLGKSIIYIGFSSALSGCINSANIARNMVLQEYPNADITIIDTKSASIGEGLLVYYAVSMLKEGKSKEEIINFIEENKLKVNHWFAVDSLKHLKNGGRISGTAATIGTILNVKPIIFINDEGELVHVTNIRGLKKSMFTLFDMFEDRVINPEEQVIGISHGDSLENALFLKSLIENKYKVKGVIINHLGPVIGSHTGPGMLSLCFLGRKRLCSTEKIK